MIYLAAFLSVARYEAKVLLRSWSFRILSALALVILILMNIGIGSKVGRAPYHFSALAGSLPLMNLKLMNVFVGIIAVFFASDWLKRDYRHDSTAVVHVRSIPNAHYVLGKVGGTVVVFLALILAVAVIGFIFHAFLSYTPFSWQPYLYYILLVNLPTLVFMIGVTLILMTLLRSQALVFILMLGYALLTLIFLKSHLFALFDVFAFFQPLFYSDFIGFSNLGELLRVRGMYFCAGIGAIGATTLLFRRLSQSRPANILMATVAIVSLSASLILGFSHLESGLAAGEYRQTLKSLSHNVAELPKAKVTDCSLDLEFKEDHLNCMADLRIVNQNSLSLDSLLFSINPGLKVTSVTSGNSEIDYRQVEHLLWIKPHRPLLPDSMMTLAITYAGTINQRYCYLDIAEERLEKTYRLFLYSIPKVYTVLGSDYLLLTAESGFYPMAGLSPGVAFPRQTSRHFVNFSLTVPTASDLKALSQGICHVDTTAAGLKYTFTSEQPLPQLSLVVGEYEERSITVDSITYSLYHRPGHAYYESYFEETGDTLTGLIRELKDDYEMQLGLEYPYLRLALVETPIQFYSYKRLWSLAQEMVQPEIVFIPELGAIGDATDFRRLQRIARRRQERANQEDSPQELAAQHFTTFVKTDLLGSSSFRLNIRSRDRIDPLSYIIPNYTSFVMQITSDRWPVLNYALESYIFSKAAAPQQTGGRRFQGLTPTERANLRLCRTSLADMLASPEKQDQRQAILAAKGAYLPTLWAAQVGPEWFAARLDTFLETHRYRAIPAESLFASLSPADSFAVEELIESWYHDTTMAGYLISDLECYNVRDGERTRSQVKFTITNPEPVAGVVEVGFRTRRREMRFMPRWLRGDESFDVSRTILMPAATTKEIGILFDDPPAEMTLETYVSRNLPSVVRKRFSELKLRENVRPFDGEVSAYYDSDSIKTAGEYVVDNEDPGFTVVTETEENLLRRLIHGLFDSEDEDEVPYVPLRFWDLPGNWQPTTASEFYGRYIHSGYFKEAGDGSQVVAWNVELAEAGDYDIYYHVAELRMPGWWRRHRRGSQDRGKKHFIVYHEDGSDEAALDLDLSESGWNLIGTYRLSAGVNRVELTDQASTPFVTADAVKWVKR